jgi:hypothetical protein
MATTKTVKVATRSYLLRGIDFDLWTGVKARAAAEGRGLRWVITELLSWYAKYGLPGGASRMVTMREAGRIRKRS